MSRTFSIIVVAELKIDFTSWKFGEAEPFKLGVIGFGSSYVLSCFGKLRFELHLGTYKNFFWNGMDS